ncbi:MAG: isoleucine--tRNA ligase [Candidatus Micrarchaeota archaeon]|nr:isoleucine--tRNA ligase [Candidatus Micrarchaeota archaeon]MDE1847373.1 isoleucine--tRNA ligase [Candidatus Micrarchaeota archaeon]MDE1863988.1 isoleucine--tRNA ligase [Candidatus Micrarchaeota archaeon]
MQGTDIFKAEEKILERWEAEQTREKVNAANKGKKKFFFLEGPPYANGQLHMGHIRAYSRKDAVMRYKRMQGFDVFDRAGFDVHGLPIENKAERELQVASKREIESKIGVSNFIGKCIEIYKANMLSQISDAKRYGAWMDFEKAYVPASPEYIDKSWKVFKKIYDKKLVYRAIQVMPYCMHCGTVLAKGPEVEEEEDTDPSVFVLFKINAAISKPRIKLGAESYLLIWTTTPWTLPANMAVCVNPKAAYVRVNISGREMILAKSRLDTIAKQFEFYPVILEEFSGSELEGIFYTNPLEEHIKEQRLTRKHHKVVFSEEMVSLDEGTGIIHIAPAYGPEDFALAKKCKIPLISLVDQDGKYNEDAGKYKGTSLIHDANRQIEAELHSNGSLLAKSTIRHNYPHCWRCHEKLIYLPTEQWFIKISKIKEKIKKQAQKVFWYPKEAKDWFLESIETAPDWVISRQRYWDIPIPIWICDSCKQSRVIGSFAELKAESGKSPPFTSESLHKPFIDEIVLKCANCGGPMHRTKDVFDVWYDSGVAHTASLSEEEFSRFFGKAFITEGPDQIRGWFATLMKTSVAAYGKTPYKELVMQGWVVDQRGEAMHKSKGNFVTASELINKYSTDAVRGFMLSHASYEMLKFYPREIEEIQANITLLYNISTLVADYAQAIKYVPTKIRKPRSPENMDPEDAWITSRLNSVIKEAGLGMETYDIHKAVSAVNLFLVNDLSRFYLKIGKRKILEAAKPRAKATVDLINYLLYNTLLLLSPIMPLNAESIYLSSYNHKQSIFMERWPKHEERLINRELEESFLVATESITAILSSREKAQIRLRWPIMSATLELTAESSYIAAQRLSNIIEEYTNTKKLILKKVEGLKMEIRPNFQALGPAFRENAGAVAQALKEADAGQIQSAISASGYYLIHTQKGAFEIKPEHFNIVQRAEETDAVSFKYGRASVDKTVSKELRAEALLREFQRRVQIMRKEFNLKKQDKIHLGYSATGEIGEAVSANVQILKKELNAATLKQELSDKGLSQDFDIEGEAVKISITKVE